MSLYPVLDDNKLETVDGFRLHEISDIKHQLENERDIRLGLYKKYHRAINFIDGFDAALVTISMGLGAAGVGLLSTIVAAPVVLGIEVAAGGAGLAGIALKFISRKLKKKEMKHDEIYTLAASKLNTISDHVSTAIEDGKISEEEFHLILSELNKYHTMKNEIRNKSRKDSSISQDEKKALIKQGREEAKAAFRTKALRLASD